MSALVDLWQVDAGPRGLVARNRKLAAELSARYRAGMWTPPAGEEPGEFPCSVAAGFECSCCGSRNTRTEITELHRGRALFGPRPEGLPRGRLEFGVSGCDDCGAC